MPNGFSKTSGNHMVRDDDDYKPMMDIEKFPASCFCMVCKSLKVECVCNDSKNKDKNGKL